MERDFKFGDIVRINSVTSTCHGKIGKICKVPDDRNRYFLIETTDETSPDYYLYRSYLPEHLRLVPSDFKVGDTVVCIKKGPHFNKAGKIFDRRLTPSSSEGDTFIVEFSPKEYTRCSAAYLKKLSLNDSPPKDYSFSVLDEPLSPTLTTASNTFTTNNSNSPVVWSVPIKTEKTKRGLWWRITSIFKKNKNLPLKV